MQMNDVGPHGDRPVLATSAVLLGVGLLGLGLAPSLTVFLLAWAIIGRGMGTGLSSCWITRLPA